MFCLLAQDGGGGSGHQGGMTNPILEADLLVSGAELITMNARREVIRDGAIAVRGNSIVAVGKREALEQGIRAGVTRDASGSATA